MCLETILARRSVRRYTSQPVADSDITELLTAAMAAPSAGNQQPWHFIVIKDHASLERIPSIHPHAHMAAAAPLAILACADESLERHTGFWVQDLSAAVQNLLLAACAKGLGSVWVGIYPREERVAAFRKMFSVPESITPFALIPIGYAADEGEPKNRYNNERVHYEQW